jgi:hypothetical protein
MFNYDYGKHYFKYNQSLSTVSHTNNTLSDKPIGLQYKQLNIELKMTQPNGNTLITGLHARTQYGPRKGATEQRVVIIIDGNCN